MAGYDENDLPDAMGALSIDDNRWEELGLDENIRAQLSKIENDYESIFSWSIKKLTGANQNFKSNLIDNVLGNLEIITVMDEKDDQFDLYRLSIELANDDVCQLNSLLLTCIESPNECFSTSAIENLVIRLSNVKNSCVNQVLGFYYLKHKKDYVKAKMYLSRGMAAGLFSSSLQLIKVECLLQLVKKFPFVKTLDMMYEVFQSPNRRLIIISQILLYYTIIENNPKQILWYLKLYLDEDIEDTLKKRNLIEKDDVRGQDMEIDEDVGVELMDFEDVVEFMDFEDIVEFMDFEDIDELMDCEDTPLILPRERVCSK